MSSPQHESDLYVRKLTVHITHTSQYQQSSTSTTATQPTLNSACTGTSILTAPRDAESASPAVPNKAEKNPSVTELSESISSKLLSSTYDCMICFDVIQVLM